MLEEGEHGGATSPAPPLPRSWDVDSALDAFVPRRRRTDIGDGTGMAEAAPSGDGRSAATPFSGACSHSPTSLAASVAVVVGGALLAADLVNWSRSSACP